MALALGASVLYVILPVSPVSQLVLYDGVVLVAVLASVSGFRRAPVAERRPWFWSSLAMTGFLVGELAWWTYEQLGIDPYPSAADLVFLASYVPLAFAASALGRRVSGEVDRAAWIDAGSLTLAAGLVVWKTLMAPYASDASLSGLYLATTLAYPLADLLVLGFALRLILLRSARTRTGSLFTIGIVCTLAADLGFSWMDLHGTYSDGGLVDLAWLVGYLFIAGAAVAVDRPPVGACGPPQESDQGLGRGRLAAVLGALAVPLVVLAVEVGEVALTTPTIAIAVAGAVSVLVATRLWGLLGRARRVEQARSQSRLSEVIHHSTDAIVLLDAESSVTYASTAFEGLTGRDPAACVGLAMATWFPEGDGSGLAGQLRNTLAMPLGTAVPVETIARREDGGLLTCEGTIVNLLDDHAVGAIVVTLRDVTLRRQLEAQLERQAFRDELTGLANRSLFVDRVSHALERFRRDPTAGVAVLFIDLDDFKAVNDGMGHGAGDELLAGVAQRLQACVRPGDTVARLGGDEFAVLIEDMADEALAEDLADRITEVLRLPISIVDLDIGVPASVGVAFGSTGTTVESLMRDADTAMYRAKALGKGRVAVFDDSLRADAAELLAMKVELPKALEDDQFRLAYQPILDVADQAISGFEALVRWDHPVRGEVPPLEFIPTAERTGMIVDLGCWVLETACRQAAEWNHDAARPLSMSVNVSPVQLREPGFLDDVRGALGAAGLAPERLTLEITESVLIDPARVEPIFEALRVMGVGIAIDDFGTGYSSLSYLKHFPITSVKIDRAFVADLTDRGDVGVVRSIIALADTMALTTVAEGVETAEQLGVLGVLSCGLAQGFYLGRPQSAGDIDALLQRRADIVEDLADLAR